MEYLRAERVGLPKTLLVRAIRVESRDPAVSNLTYGMEVMHNYQEI
jgi:hypothetical protein